MQVCRPLYQNTVSPGPTGPANHVAQSRGQGGQSYRGLIWHPHILSPLVAVYRVVLLLSLLQLAMEPATTDRSTERAYIIDRT
jgi:hypothetical protein